MEVEEKKEEEKEEEKTEVKEEEKTEVKEEEKTENVDVSAESVTTGEDKTSTKEDGGVSIPKKEVRESKAQTRPFSSSGSEPRQRRTYFRKKVCKLCVKKAKSVDYKDADLLKRFITERGKILPRRITGTCARHQRMLSRAIRRARMIALLPFVSK
jgi:small subunit ribosomal protein S18